MKTEERKERLAQLRAKVKESNTACPVPWYCRDRKVTTRLGKGFLYFNGDNHPDNLAELLAEFATTFSRGITITGYIPKEEQEVKP
jgi:hypothetical protein